MDEKEIQEKLDSKDIEIQDLKDEVEKWKDIVDDYRRWCRNCPE